MLVRRMYAEKAKSYDAQYYRSVDEAENNIVFSALRRIRGCVLDLGCGTGLIPSNVEFDDYLGVDFVPEMVDIARSRGHIILCEDIYDLDLEPASFDAVISTFGSFSYLQDPREIVAKIRRFLRPGGSIYIMVYGYKYRTRCNYILRGQREGLRVFYTPAELSSLFSQLPVSGLNSLGDGLRLPVSLLELYLRLERFLPLQFYWLIVEGILR